MSSRLTATQRMLLTRLLTAELVRTRAAALAAGAHQADLDEATDRRCRVIEAMTPGDTDTAESDR